MEPGRAGAADQHYIETRLPFVLREVARDRADLFTDDAVYREHSFGTFDGPEEIYVG